MSIKITSLLIAMIASATAINASVPIIVGYGKGRRAVMNLFTNAEDRLKHGDTAGAKLSLIISFRSILGVLLLRGRWATVPGFQATCPNASFRNGRQAVKDAKAACSLMAWKDENMIDTLAAAYVETGDFDSAARCAAQALAIKGIEPVDSKRIQRHLTLFQQHQPIRL
jgi:hypothetical protein